MYFHIKIIVTILRGKSKKLTYAYMRPYIVHAGNFYRTHICAHNPQRALYIAFAGRIYASIAFRGLKCVTLPFINPLFSPN